MAGYVRSNDKCPICHKSYQLQLAGRIRVMICPEHHTSPTRVYVDTSGFGLKKRKRYSDRDGNVFTSAEAACQFLDAMRAAKASRAGWDPAEWDEPSRKEYRFEEEWTKWVEYRSPKWGARYVKQVDHVRKNFIAPRWGELDMRDIRTAHIMDLESTLQKDGRAPSYIRENGKRG